MPETQLPEAPLPGLDEALLRHRLVETGPYARLSRVQATGSTNADLLAAAQRPDFHEAWPHLSVLTAEEQTGGRGRLARAWSSPSGTSLSTSVVLRPSLPVEQRHWLSLTAGCALVETLRGRGLPAGIKWPNDVHIAGRKVAGILAAVPSESPETVIVGCGINVLLTAEQLPTATSTSVLLELESLNGGPLDLTAGAGAQLRTELLCQWLENFAKLVTQAQQAGDISPVRDTIISAISTVGEKVRVELPDGTAVRGAAVAVKPDGALVVEVSERRRTPLDAEAGGGGEHLWSQTARPVRESFHAGDVVHLRRV